MRAITLTQPWASLVALGWKGVETRSWRPKYRGPLAIHAAKGHPWRRGEVATIGAFTVENDGGGLLLRGPISHPYRLPLGAVVATCTLARTVPTESCLRHLDVEVGQWMRDMRDNGDVYISPGEWHVGDYTPGRFAWLLTDVKPLRQPVPATGRQQLWTWEPPV